MHFSTFASAAALFQLSIAGYVLEDDYMSDFYGSFDFFTDPDPTHGFVKYVDEATARSSNLINASTTVPVEWGVDTTTKPTDGRPSIRLASKKTYNTGLVVIDVQHMPFGCGTWPAFWMVGPDWPNGGEIDVLEGVHEQETNAITLHTNSGCSIATDGNAFAGDVSTSNCDVKAPNQDENAGCSIKQQSSKSYGAGLNGNGGGVYATEWTTDAISVYFFPRGEVPQDVLGDSPDPSGWGTPAARFASSSCNIEQHFKEQQIVFDTTFCGDWAGNTWSSSSCASKAATCNEYVQNNPEAFTDAFWTVNALKVYSNNGEAPQPSEPASPPESSAVPVPTGETTEVPIPSVTGLPSIIPTIEPPNPSDSSVAVSKPVPTSSGIDSPPIIDPSTVPTAPSETPVPSAPAPSGVPSGPRRSRGGHHGRPTQSLNNNVVAPTGGTGDGNMGGFQWPSGGSGDAESNPVPSGTAAPFPVPGNSTIPLPTGTGTGVPSQFTSIALNISSVPAETAIGAQPTNLESMPSFGDATATPSVTAPAVPTVTDINEVVETVYKTVVVTVTPGETPAPGSRRARHVRAHRRRMVQHNGGR
ncbi:glycoside hydrolase family 16 protein [Trematosphaeria pertusa]|uniref:endo-1,3(4)-beta-glucanase n=1 Tax=Trematosphaeria pertusa TaxID=390896 RepID=A0A6A6ISK8_9PLEO|nr:glycoside hydrolase family 16 protein [Trematosphaeria pertusa]KAF2253269.1 glycoside hydrolase family 16 protein [Trematosphaeria pertusa]